MSETKWTPEPWSWMVLDGCPQLIGNVEDAEMSPVLVASGCGNDEETASGVKGCNAWGLHETDPMRSCPLHPSKEDRERIVTCVNSLAGIENPAEFVAKVKDLIAYVRLIGACSIGGDPRALAKSTASELADMLPPDLNDPNEQAKRRAMGLPPQTENK